MRTTTMQTNLTAGELSPRLMGRVDIARYANGAQSITNAIPMVHGGCKRRPGTVFIAGVKNSTQKSRLIPYVFSRDQAYILEFGNYYMRVYMNRAQVLDGSVPYEIATPYSEIDLADIAYVQGADTMFLAHPGYPMQRLRRFGHDNWVLDPVPFVVVPFDELGYRHNNALYIDDVSVGIGRSFSSGTNPFVEADVGREITSGSGRALITAYVSTGIVTATITSAFESSPIPSGSWKIEGSPLSAIVPSAAGPVGETITLDATTVSMTTTSASKTVGGISVALGTATVTIVGHGYSSLDTILHSGADVAALNGAHLITVIDANSYSFSVPVATPNPTTLGSATKTATTVVGIKNTWRSADVGKFVQINGGLVKITGYTSPTSVTGEVYRELSSSTTAVGGGWSIESDVWNVTDGYPRAVTLFEQRLVAAGSPGYPQTVWMSRIDEYLNFELGTNDDAAMSFTISSDQVNPIVSLGQIKALVALSYGGEFTMTGGVEKPITPTNIQVKNQSVYGCAGVRPLRIGNELYFMQRAGRKLRAMAYKFDTDAFGSPDMSVLAEHVTESGIVDMSYQQEPESIVWAVRADGILVSLTVDRDQDVVGWARHTGGSFRSIATIPNSTGEETWLIVERTIAGIGTVKYVEVFDDDVRMDSAVSGYSFPASDEWTGLDHLEGMEVDIVADGAVQARQTVAGGKITLTKEAVDVTIGLPFTPQILLLTPEIVSGAGSSQGNHMRTSEIVLRFLETLGCTVNGQVVAFKELGLGALTNPPQTFTGDHRVTNLGWDKGISRILIEQPQPLPFHLLAVIRKFTVND